MLTFIHDHIFLKHNDEYYTSGSLTRDVLHRYLNVFGSINLVTRCKNVTSKQNNLKPSSGKNTKFTCVPNYKKIMSLFYYFRARKIIKEEVLKAQYLILRTGSFANIAAKYARKYDKPYLIEVVGCSWDGLWNYSLLGKLLAPFSYLAQKKTVKNADYALYVTESFLQKRYPTYGKTTNCSNVALTEFSEITLDQRIEKIENKEMHNIIIGTTAAVDVKYKGQQYIIEALGNLKKKGLNNFEYQIVGSGDQTFLKSVARKFNVEEKVKFIGSLSHNEVFDWLDTIDIYAQPSRQEGLPRALIEAMSRGLPAFGANTGGIPELIDDEFIFSNTRANINQICSILMSFTKKSMLKQAEKNFDVSKKYNMNFIEERRRTFFEEFQNSIHNIL